MIAFFLSDLGMGRYFINFSFSERNGTKMSARRVAKSSDYRTEADQVPVPFHRFASKKKKKQTSPLL